MKDRATAYAEQVVAGDVVAGELHIQACRRHLRDLERQGTDEFPYLWRPEKSEEILAEVGLKGRKQEKWTPEEKEQLHAVLPEVGMWPELAERWLNRQLK